jgi:hypothetical protein
MKPLPKYKTREYSSWHNMWQRCCNPNSTSFDRYGGRGIVICKQWRSFDSFLKDMGKRPPGTSIDRINNNGNYEPGNCRWADGSTQMKNREPYTWKNENPRRVGLSGKVFSRLRVISPSGVSVHNKSLWICECKCGNRIVAVSSNLINGNTQSCGCRHRDIVINSNRTRRLKNVSHNRFQ